MATVTDAKFDALRAAGHTGSLTDMLLAWYQANGATSPQPNKAKREFLDALGYTHPDINYSWKKFLADRGYSFYGDGSIGFWQDGMPLEAPTLLSRYKGQVFGDSISWWPAANAGFGSYLDGELSQDVFNENNGYPALTTNETRNMFTNGHTQYVYGDIRRGKWYDIQGNYVIFNGGANDISTGLVTETQRRDNISFMADTIIASGQLLIIMNITPSVNWTAPQNAEIAAHNSWLASTYPSHYYDLHSLVEDPANPGELLPAYDHGDGLHLNVTAYQAIDAAIAPRFTGAILGP